MEELGYHKATLSSTLAVVICGTKYHFFTLVLHLSATMQPTFQCILICGPDMMYTFRLCPCLLQTDVRQRCPLKVSAAICAENTLHALQSAHMGPDDMHLPSEPQLCPVILCLAFSMQHQKDYETWGDMKATRGSVSEERKAT